MIVRGWQIEGFGVFRGHEARDLQTGLTVVEGANEAGKSTLLAFLRFVLFGFARGEPNRYPPLAGGRHGGRLTLEQNGEIFTLERLERHGAHLIAPDGRDLGEEGLRALLGRIDRDIFRSVFAFSLWELSNLETLSQQEVRDRLYSVGITGAGKSATSALRELDQRKDALVRQRSRDAKINALADRLADVRTSLARAQAQAEDYAALARREQEAEAAVAALTQEARRLRERSRTLSRLGTLYVPWNRLRRLEEQLRSTPSPKEIPDALVREMDELLARRRDLVAEIEQRTEQEGDLASRVEALSPAKERLAVAYEVEALTQDLSLWAERLRELEEVSKDLPRIQAEIAARAQELGLDPNAPLPAVGFAERQEIETWEERLADVSEQRRRADVLALEAQAAVEEGQAERSRLEEACAALGDAPDLASLDVRIVSLSSLGRSIEYAARRRANWALAAAAFLALALLGGTGAALHQTALVSPGILGLLALLYLIVGRPGAAVRRARQDAAAQAARLGLGSRPDTAAVEQALRDAEALRPRATERERADEALAHAGELLQRREESLRRAEEARKARAGEQRAADEEFLAFKRAKGLPPGLSPGLLDAYVAEVQDLRQRMEERARREARTEELQQALGAFRRQAETLLETAGCDVPEDPERLLGEIRALAQTSQAVREAHTGATALALELEGLRRRLFDLRASLGQVEEGIEARLRRAGAADEGGFHAMRDALAAYRSLAEACDAARAQYLDQAGTSVTALEAELREGDPARWAADEDEIVERLQALEDVETPRALGEAQDLRRAREELAQTAEVAQRAAEEEQLRTDLQRAIREWRVVVTARRLLERTLEIYVRDRQPEVLRVASNAFRHLSAQRYEAVRQRVDGGGIQAVDRSGAVRSPEELSRGTAEQLYLALRLGLVASFGDRVASLPLVLDDVLVNFDPARTRAALSVLGEFAATQGRQALLFTCHPSVRELALEQVPGARSLLLSAPDADRDVAAAKEPDLDGGRDLFARIADVLRTGPLSLREIHRAMGGEEKAVRRAVEESVARGLVDPIGEGRGRRYRKSGAASSAR